MNLDISGFLGAFKVEVQLIPGKTALLAGENGAGKSSTITAARAVLSAVALPPDWEKQDAKDLVHDAVDEAAVKFSYPEGPGERLITYPACDTFGRGAPIVNGWALGSKILHALPMKERFSELVSILGAKVDGPTLRKELDKLEHLAKEHKDALVLKAIGNGYEVAQAAAEGYARELKGTFKAVAGCGHGANQGLTFKPLNWEEMLEKASLDDLKTAAIEAQKEHDEAVGKAALANAAAEHAGKKDEYATKLSEWTGKIDETVIQLQSARFALSESLTCSGCGMVGRSYEGNLVATDHVDTSNYKPSNVKDLEQRLANAQLAMGVTKANFEEAVKHEGVAAERVDVAAFKAKLAQAVHRVAAKVNKEKGIALHYQIMDTLKAADIVSPSGLPRRILLNALEAFNKDMATICELAGWNAFWIDNNLGLRCTTRDYRRLSKGQRFRADATLQLAIAKKQKQSVVVMDELEALDKPGRNQLFTVLANSEVAALIALTTSKDRDGNVEIPDLAKAGIGTTYVIEAGVSKPLGAA